MKVYIVWYELITVTNKVVTAMWGIYATKEKAQNELKKLKMSDAWIEEEIVQQHYFLYDNLDVKHPNFPLSHLTNN